MLSIGFAPPGSAAPSGAGAHAPSAFGLILPIQIAQTVELREDIAVIPYHIEPVAPAPRAPQPAR